MGKAITGAARLSTDAAADAPQIASATPTAGHWGLRTLLGWLFALLGTELAFAAAAPWVELSGIPSPGLGYLLGTTISGFVEGLGIGVGQWLVGRRLGLGRAWIPATAIGWGAAMRVVDLVGTRLDQGLGGGELTAIPAWALAGAAGGTVLGACQWLALRSGSRDSVWWVPFSVVSAAISTAVFGAVQLGSVGVPVAVRQGILPGRSADGQLGVLLALLWLAVALAIGVLTFAIMSAFALKRLVGPQR
jgi:hypothetical protein